jgi:hypothetical protein
MNMRIRLPLVYNMVLCIGFVFSGLGLAGMLFFYVPAIGDVVLHDSDRATLALITHVANTGAIVASACAAILTFCGHSLWYRWRQSDQQKSRPFAFTRTN